jgi:hypothetical protein
MILFIIIALALPGWLCAPANSTFLITSVVATAVPILLLARNYKLWTITQPKTNYHEQQ